MLQINVVVVMMYNSEGTLLNAEFLDIDNREILNNIAFDSVGNLYVATALQKDLRKYNSEGNLLVADVTPKLDWPYNPTFDSVGNLYVMDSDGIVPGYHSQYNSDGTLRNAKFITGLNTPVSMAFDIQSTPKTWIGGNGNWNVDENWSPRGVPSNNHKIIIDGKNGEDSIVKLDVDFTISHTLQIDSGDKLVVNKGSTLVIDSGGVLDNTGELSNYGMISNNLDGVLNNNGYISISADSAINNFGKFNNQVLAEVVLSGNIFSKEIVDVTNDGVIVSHGVMKDNVHVTNFDGKTHPDNSDIFYNDGTLNNDGLILSAGRYISQ